MKKKIFISYSDEDKNKMRSLERIINKTRSFSPIIIADRRQALVPLTEKVKTGIFECDYFIPILTRNSIFTQWVNQEIGFATAINREIIPLTERGLISTLKGFVHKQLDLSYSFIGNEVNSKSEASAFTKICNILINDLLLENDITPRNPTIENLFPGKWRSVYILEDGRSGSDEEIEVKDGNVYYLKGSPVFTIEPLEIDIKHGVIKFKKHGIPPDNRVAYDEISIIELGKKYDGLEDKTTRITYYRIN